MKRSLTTPLKLFLLYLAATNNTTAQVTITGQLPKDYPHEQLLYTDAGELELPRDYDTLSVEAQSFKLSIPADKVRAVTIGLPQEYTAQTVQYHTFYLQPGDQLQLHFQYASGSRELVMQVQGPNAAGYEAWAAFNRQYSPPIRYLQPFYDLQPTLPNLRDTLIAKIESHPFLSKVYTVLAIRMPFERAPFLQPAFPHLTFLKTYQIYLLIQAFLHYMVSPQTQNT